MARENERTVRTDGVVAVSHAFGAAIREQDFEWATREDIESLFAPTVDYLNVHGDFFQGRDAR